MDSVSSWNGAGSGGRCLGAGTGGRILGAGTGECRLYRLHCILCIIIFYLTVLNLILNQFLYHFKIPCFIIFNFLFLLL